MWVSISFCGDPSALDSTRSISITSGCMSSDSREGSLAVCLSSSSPAERGYGVTGKILHRCQGTDCCVQHK